MTPQWLAQRTNAFDSSGIRKVFDLASSLKDPINLSIGQPDFDVPHDVRLAAVDAIQSGKNGYALTHGMPVLREKLQTEIDGQYNHSDRRVLVTSGVSGGLLLAIFALLDPGDEVIVFDPYFVMYEPLVSLVGGVCVFCGHLSRFSYRCQQNRSVSISTHKTNIVQQPDKPNRYCHAKKTNRTNSGVSSTS